MAAFYCCLKCGGLKCVFLHELFCPECQAIIDKKADELIKRKESKDA